MPENVHPEYTRGFYDGATDLLAALDRCCAPASMGTGQHITAEIPLLSLIHDHPRGDIDPTVSIAKAIIEKIGIARTRLAERDAEADHARAVKAGTTDPENDARIADRVARGLDPLIVEGTHA